MSDNDLIHARNDDLRAAAKKDGHVLEDALIPRSALPYFNGFYEVDDNGDRVPEPVVAEEAEELKGPALKEALELRGLPKSGTNADKRARIVEHDAELAALAEQEAQNPADSDPAVDGQDEQAVNPDA